MNVFSPRRRRAARRAATWPNQAYLDSPEPTERDNPTVLASPSEMDHVRLSEALHSKGSKSADPKGKTSKPADDDKDTSEPLENNWRNGINSPLDPLAPPDEEIQSAPALKPLSYEIPIERISNNDPFWSEYIREAALDDRDRLEGWIGDLDTLLVFAGLFSAILTAFLIEVYSELKPDSTEAIVNAINELRDTNKPSSNGNASATASAFVATPKSVRINALWFASLACSLMAAAGAMLSKSWCQEYSRQSSIGSPYQRALRRQARYNGMVRWRFEVLIDCLPLLLYLSITLFVIGLSDLLFGLNQQIAIIVTSIVGFFSLFAVFTTITSLLVPDCPYRIPVVRRALDIARSLKVLVTLARGWYDVRAEWAKGNTLSNVLDGWYWDELPFSEKINMIKTTFAHLISILVWTTLHSPVQGAQWLVKKGTGKLSSLGWWKGVQTWWKSIRGGTQKDEEEDEEEDEEAAAFAWFIEASPNEVMINQLLRQLPVLLSNRRSIKLLVNSGIPGRLSSLVSSTFAVERSSGELQLLPERESECITYAYPLYRLLLALRTIGSNVLSHQITSGLTRELDHLINSGEPTREILWAGISNSCHTGYKAFSKIQTDTTTIPSWVLSIFLDVCLTDRFDFWMYDEISLSDVVQALRITPITMTSAISFLRFLLASLAPSLLPTLSYDSSPRAFQLAIRCGHLLQPRASNAESAYHTAAVPTFGPEVSNQTHQVSSTSLSDDGKTAHRLGLLTTLNWLVSSSTAGSSSQRDIVKIVADILSIPNNSTELIIEAVSVLNELIDHLVDRDITGDGTILLVMRTYLNISKSEEVSSKLKRISALRLKKILQIRWHRNPAFTNSVELIMELLEWEASHSSSSGDEVEMAFWLNYWLETWQKEHDVSHSGWGMNYSIGYIKEAPLFEKLHDAGLVELNLKSLSCIKKGDAWNMLKMAQRMSMVTSIAPTYLEDSRCMDGVVAVLGGSNLDEYDTSEACFTALLMWYRVVDLMEPKWGKERVDHWVKTNIIESGCLDKANAKISDAVYIHTANAWYGHAWLRRLEDIASIYPEALISSGILDCIKANYLRLSVYEGVKVAELHGDIREWSREELIADVERVIEVVNRGKNLMGAGLVKDGVAVNSKSVDPSLIGSV